MQKSDVSKKYTVKYNILHLEHPVLLNIYHLDELMFFESRKSIMRSNEVIISNLMNYHRLIQKM